jgi:peptidoglycan/LPS O-acetylase OafA/YrhL
MDLRKVSLERVPFLEEEVVEDKELIPVSSQEKRWNGSKYLRFRHFLQNVRNTPRLRPRWSPERTQSLKTATLNFASFFIPSFLRRNTERKELHETAYLDGLRGFACYAVFFSHYTTAYCNEVWHPYGEGGNHHFVQTYYIFQLPIFRLIYNGQAAVTIFFVLSGYVLSYKPLKLIQSRDFEKLQSSLGSAIFRRWFRLFLPVAALWIINIFLVEFGAYSWFTKFHEKNPKMPPGIVEEYLPAGESFWGTVYNAYKSYFDFARGTLFSWTKNGILPNVDGHTWTLHVEFRSSCILFLFLHGCSKMRANLRLAFFLFSSAFCLYWDEWAIGTFLAGSAIADLDLRIRRRQQSSSSDQQGNDSDSSFALVPFSRISPRFRTLFRASQFRWGILFIFSLLILSYPAVGADKVFFYRTLSYYHPYSAWDLFFWEAVGAILIVYVVGRFRLAQRVLEWNVSQYMGKTSFALYLMHGTVIKTLGHWSVIHAWKVTGYKGWGYAWGILLPILVVLPVTVVVSDWFWRGVDVPSVRLAKWIEGLVRDRDN